MQSVAKFLRNWTIRSGIRTKSTTKLDPSANYTVVAENGVIFCWHPENKFPYEHSRPIPVEAKAQEIEQLNDQSVLNEELLKDRRLRYIPESGPSANDLREMFYVDRQEFVPRYREKRLYASAPAKPKYREGL